MKRRTILKSASAAALALFLPLDAGRAEPVATKPNIIFIMVDDLGYHDLGCYGSKTMLTPNLDKMCAEGMKFTDCYGGCTVCAPSRSVLMSGYHKGHTHVRDNRGGIPLWPGEITVADVLKKAGYATGGFGKWGLGNQGKKGAAELHGFDVFFGYYNQWHAHSYYTHLFRNSEKVELDGRYTHYPKHEYMYWDDSWYHNEGVRMGKWKGIRRNSKFEVNPNTAEHRGKWKGMKHETGPVEVYDLSKDRGEKNNLAEKHPDIAKKLGELMDQAWTEPRSQEDDGVYTGKPAKTKKN